MGFVTRVRRTLERRRLLGSGRRIVVACSGGPDSSALLQALFELSGAFSLELTAVSVDHGLRPAAAAEVELVRSHAEALGVGFRAVKVCVDGGRGKQAGARAARYAALAELAAELGAEHIATGHTLDDQAETVLARLLRGPSVRALSAIQPARGDGVIRPLIDVRRSDVERFVAQRGLRVARDPSNEDPAYTRSRIRHQLLPHLMRENPRLVEALAWLAEDATEHVAAVDALCPVLDLSQVGAREALREQSGPVRRSLLGTWIAKHTGEVASSDQLRRLDGDHTPEGVLLTAGLRARWGRDGALRIDTSPKRTRGR